MKPDLPPMAIPNEALAAMIFELASQLHVERAHRIALELALEQAGLVSVADRTAASAIDARRERSVAAADQALRKLFRAMNGACEPDERLFEKDPDLGA